MSDPIAISKHLLDAALEVLLFSRVCYYYHYHNYHSGASIKVISQTIEGGNEIYHYHYHHHHHHHHHYHHHRYYEKRKKSIKLIQVQIKAVLMTLVLT